MIAKASMPGLRVGAPFMAAWTASVHIAKEAENHAYASGLFSFVLFSIKSFWAFLESEIGALLIGPYTRPIGLKR